MEILFDGKRETVRSLARNANNSTFAMSQEDDDASREDGWAVSIETLDDSVWIDVGDRVVIKEGIAQKV